MQRLENLYKDLPAFHQRLQQEQRRLQGELDDLRGTDLGQFEHTAQLSAKRQELAALTAELRLESESEAAKAAAAAAQQRLLDADREPRWSLHLNPTPALIADAGLPDADSYRFMQQRKERARARDYACCVRCGPVGVRIVGFGGRVGRRLRGGRVRARRGV